MLYSHDCNQCVWLGEYKDHDLYVCPKQLKGKEANTLLARYGNDGPDYLSGWEFWQTNDIIREARERAIQMGFYYRFDSNNNKID